MMTERGVCVRPLNQQRHRGRHARRKGMEGRGLGLMARSYQRHRPCGVDSSPPLLVHRLPRLSRVHGQWSQ